MIRIGITSSAFAWPDDDAGQTRLRNYLLSLENAGAQGDLLFLGEHAPADADAFAAQFDGLLLSGGADLPTHFYNEEPREGAHLEFVPIERPMLEWALCDAFARRGKPILGICYGCQLLNVWAGGGLLQDIELQWPNAIAHRARREAPHIEARHEIRIASDSALARVLETTSGNVNSYHHQGVAQAAPRGRAVAQAPDGILEAVEFGTLEKGDFILGVQWHPERERDSAITQKLFGAFVKACR
jgi:putative glutamine amidotransferase